MSIVAEDGTGLSNANSYASYADWTAYWADRGAAPSSVQADVEQALVRATDYLGLRYTWIGQRALQTQALDWPRVCAYAVPAGGYSAPIEGVPPEVVRATVELAQRALAGELAPDPVVDTTGQPVVGSRKKIGPIEVETTFGGGGATFTKRFPAVDELLRWLVVKNGARVYRA